MSEFQDINITPDQTCTCCLNLNKKKLLSWCCALQTLSCSTFYFHLSAVSKSNIYLVWLREEVLLHKVSENFSLKLYLKNFSAKRSLYFTTMSFAVFNNFCDNNMNTTMGEGYKNEIFCFLVKIVLIISKAIYIQVF